MPSSPHLHATPSLNHHLAFKLKKVENKNKIIVTCQGKQKRGEGRISLYFSTQSLALFKRAVEHLQLIKITFAGKRRSRETSFEGECYMNFITGRVTRDKRAKFFLELNWAINSLKRAKKNEADNYLTEQISFCESTQIMNVLEFTSRTMPREYETRVEKRARSGYCCNEWKYYELHSINHELKESMSQNCCFEESLHNQGKLSWKIRSTGGRQTRDMPANFHANGLKLNSIEV